MNIPKICSSCIQSNFPNGSKLRMAGYTKNYILIYATQAVSMLLGMLSVFVVMPHLSSNQEVYGIYAICSSLTVFFSYADIGFVTSGQKFAAEAYIKKDLNSATL